MKKTISLFLSFLMLLSVFVPLSAFAKTDSGKCGENAYYELKDGVLTISGTGEVTSKPWLDSFRDKIIKADVDEGITKLPFHCFEKCKSLMEAYLPESLIGISSGAFINCENLEKADLPSGIDYIGSSAFYNCVSLKKISLPKNVKKIYTSAFRNCKSATGKIKIPRDAFVNTWAFRNCDKISEVIFENGFHIDTEKYGKEWHSDEDECFMDCDGLKSVKIPGSFKLIPLGYFNNCKALDNVQISEGVETIAGFTNCISLKKIVLPKSVKVIEGGAFCGCKKLTSVKIQSKLDEIAPRAFHNCPSLTVVLPYGVDKLYDTSMGYTQKKGSNQYKKIKNFKIYGKKCKVLTDYCKENGFKFIDMYDVKNATATMKSQTYNGSAKKPSVTVKLAGITLKKDTDYTVKYSNNTKVGTAKVTLTGIGKYKGTLEKTFKINPKPTELTKLTPKSKSFKAYWKKNKSQTSGYQIQYSVYKSFKNAKKVTVKGYKTGAKTIKDLKSKKKYFVRVRAYKVVDGKKYYSKWSNSKTVKTK